MVPLFASTFSRMKALNELISFWVTGPLRLSMTRAAPGSRPKHRQTASEGTQYLITSTANLKPIQDAAVKENATEASKLIERLVACRGPQEPMIPAEL